MPAKPLTKAEAAWLKKLDAVLKSCPSNRMQCYTIGDKELTFYDTNVLKLWQSENPRNCDDMFMMVEKAGAKLGVASGSFFIDSTAG